MGQHRDYRPAGVEFRDRVDDPLSPEQLVEWGWRVPFLFGILVGPVGLCIRRRLDETPEYVEI
jgi:hypothetical protein